MVSFSLSSSSLAACTLLLGSCVGAPESRPSLRFEREDALGRLVVRDGGHVILGMRYGEELAIPHWFPLRSPSGRDLVVEHPDPYPHHRALWIADRVQLEDGKTVDFYHCTKNRIDGGESEGAYRHFIRHEAMPLCAVDGERFVCDWHLRWVIDGTRPVLDDERRTVVRSLGRGEALIDLSWTLRASYGAVTFHSDAVHYAWPYLRIAPEFSVAGGAGMLVDDRGRVGQNATNGEPARWVDYSATIDGVTEGVAVFASPDGEPRSWLTRDYGTFGPRRPDARNGRKFRLARGESISGRVRLYVHRGDSATGHVAQRYSDYCAEFGGPAVDERVALPDAQMLIPRDLEVGEDGFVPLALHFQGSVAIAEKNFARMGRPGVLIASRIHGLSGAFSKPYRDPAAFRTLLAAGERELGKRVGRPVRFGPILVTFFSAGYGAVREILREPEFFDRITALVSADSIYADVVADDVRAPRAEQMIDFLRFAQAAARGAKIFVLAHGKLPTPYASTAECADLILAAVAGERAPSHAITETGVPIASEFHRRGFHLYTFDEASGEHHLECLRMIPELVRRHTGGASQSPSGGIR